jgi:hypothetical protein
MERKTSRYRLVDRYVVHDGCASLAERIAEIIPPEAEYVVFDLDRTVHLGVTIGERLGWELTANPVLASGTGQDELEPIFTVRAPWRSARGLSRGVRYWGLAGLLYAATVRLGDHWGGWHRSLMLTLGPGYVEHVQSLLRAVLMASAAGYTVEQLSAFCDRAWRRWQSRLVVDAGVIAAVRAHCPHLKAVLLSSASTAPTVEHAARELGVDGFVSSAVDLYADGDRMVYSAPVGVPLGLRRRRPRFFSRPGAVVHNSAANKVSFLRVHYPEVFARGTVAVGVTDNNYGEDRTWPDYFTHVVALNSRHPFSPFVAADSPCESIQIVDAVPAGAADLPREKKFRWHGKLRARAYDRGKLAERFGAAELGRIEALVEQLRAARERTTRAVDASYRSSLATLGAALTDAVDRYNRASARQKAAIGRELAGLSRTARRMRARVSRAGRECARIQHDLERLHDEAARFLASREL